MRLLLCALLITSNAIACDYESDDLIQYEGHIESVRVLDKKVYPYVEDTRICTMHIESRVKGEWYSSPPVISIRDNAGRGRFAEFNAIVENGKITGFTKISEGEFYTQSNISVVVTPVGSGAEVPE